MNALFIALAVGIPALLFVLLTRSMQPGRSRRRRGGWSGDGDGGGWIGGSDGGGHGDGGFGGGSCGSSCGGGGGSSSGGGGCGSSG